MKQRTSVAVAAILVLALTGCASFGQLGCIFTSCAMTDGQLSGISGKATPLLSAVADAKEPGLAALLSVALSSKEVGALGVLLPFTLTGETTRKLVVCPGGKLATACMALPVNKPVKIWARPLAGSEELYLLTKLDS